MKPLIEHTKWEKDRKEIFQSKHTPFQDSVDVGSGKGYDFQSFSQDMFSSLYQTRPDFPQEATTGSSWAKKALDELQSLPEYKQTRKQGTVLDHIQSGLGASILTSHFAESLPKMSTQNPDNLQQQINGLKDLMHDFDDQPEKQQKIQNRIDNATDALHASNEEWTQAADNMDMGQVRQVFRKALQETQDKADQLQDMADPFGFGTEPGKDGFTNPEDKYLFAEKISQNPRLREIAKLAGRFKREARKAQANKKQPGPDEISNVETGADLDLVLPAESMKLADEALEMGFMRNYLERGLFQYKLEENPEKNEGPIVICIDESGSMSGARDTWAKAMALAIATIAADKNRPFTIIHFDSNVNHVDEFKDTKNIDPEKMLEAISRFSGGGTNFVLPLQSAFHTIKTNKNFEKADIIFITDGTCPIDATIKDSLKMSKGKLKTDIYTIILESQDTYGDISSLSDSVTTIPDLLSDSADQEAKNVAFNI